MRFMAMLAGVLLSAIASAATLSYSPPTTYTDGSPLPSSAITGYEFRCGAGTTAGITCTPLSLPGTATGGTMAITGPASGFTACVEGRTLVGSNASAYSVPACKTFAAVPPNPPGNVVISQVLGIDIAIAYSVNVAGTKGSAVVGLIPVGRQCLGDPVGTYRSQVYRRVARADVIWAMGVKASDRVSAPCSSS